MSKLEIRQKILEHLDGLNKLESLTDSENLIRTLAERYNVSTVIIEQVIAEWSAGRPK